MADQQFLASFGVDIDESGISRLQKILAENRTLAESLSASFNVASESVKAFRESISEDFPTLFSGSGYGNVTENFFGEYAGLKIGLNMTEPKKEIASFTENAKKPIPLTANASSIVSAARTAMESVRSLFSETFTLNVRAETNTDRKSEEPSSRQDSRNREETGSAFLRMSSGGRFSRPTSVQVAEDGDAEYIIPVKKENRALPLLQQLMGELSPEARESLTPSATVPEKAAESPDLSSPSAQQPRTEADEPILKQIAPSTVIPNDPERSFDRALPPVKETLAEETAPAVSVQMPAPEIFMPAPVAAPATEKEPAPTAPVIPDLRKVLAEADRPPASVSAPVTEEKDPPGPAPVIPDLRKVLAEADRPLASVPAAQKESFPSANDSPSPKQNLSDLVSQLSSALRPAGASVTNTSSNVSAPVTINVNANGSDANRIGQSIYDTAERYLLRTLRSSVSS